MCVACVQFRYENYFFKKKEKKRNFLSMSLLAWIVNIRKWCSSASQTFSTTNYCFLHSSLIQFEPDYKNENFLITLAKLMSLCTRYLNK